MLIFGEMDMADNASLIRPTSYAAATQGIIFDHQEAKAFTPKEARDTVRGIERDIPRIKAAIAEGIRKLTKPT